MRNQNIYNLYKKHVSLFFIMKSLSIIIILFILTSFSFSQEGAAAYQEYVGKTSLEKETAHQKTKTEKS